MLYDEININVVINDIEFIIKSIDDKGLQIYMIAETSYNNYNYINKWFGDTLFTLCYKVNYEINSIVLFGIYPINLDLVLYNKLKVTFSIDGIKGDLKLLKLKEIRKKKIEKICQIYS